MFNLLAILLVLTALGSYLNHKFLRLPDAIGVMVLTLTASLCVVIAASYHPSARSLAEGYVKQFDFGKTVLHGMLGFLLFAGSLHVNLEAVLRKRLSGC
jgi:CPA1 family monovalent cation:H+ antiporter